jgi:hypothetical protein
MKRIKSVFIVTLLFATMSAFAQANYQDVVYLNNGSIVRGVIVEQIPNKTLKIETADGSVFVFNVSEIEKMTKEKVGGTQSNSTPERVADKPSTPSVKSLSGSARNEFYAIGDDDDRMLDFFKTYDKHYYNQFEQACAQRRKGKVLLGVGIGLQGVGVICFIASAVSDSDIALGYYVMGVLTGVTGEILTIVSIPVSATAGAKKKSIKNNFEEDYFKKGNLSYQPTLNFGVNTNGVGFTLNF